MGIHMYPKKRVYRDVYVYWILVQIHVRFIHQIKVYNTRTPTLRTPILGVSYINWYTDTRIFLFICWWLSVQVFFLIKYLVLKQSTFRLLKSNTICFTLISDIWTTKNLHDFLPISLNISNIFYKRETLVIGMIKMPGNHNAERIKEAI